MSNCGAVLDCEPWEVDKIRERAVHYRLPCGRLISSAGLPEGLEVEKHEKILQGMLQKQMARGVTKI